ncbi:hypothetical protein PIB30_069348 [Stylosanthes scabra]|uniref:Aminotransferase-like plant mobile domain-containing protein n=1 Tax=Stylosanthes scabra TaxID=79078 RepID=A0ABU6WLF8_9FABA|nr:hypothetical protein [Stylosanthes scabra]
MAEPLDLLQSWIFWRFSILPPYGFDEFEWPLASRWGRFLPTSDETGPGLQAHRKQLNLMSFRKFVYLPYRTQAVEVVLDRCILQEDHRALWCSIVPLLYFKTIEWHQSADPGPTVDFLQWWILDARRYLVPADSFHRLPPDEIPVEATLRQSAPHAARPFVPHVPDNKRLGRRMMAEDAPAERPTQMIRRIPKGYGRRRGASRARRGGRAGRGRREGGDTTPTQQTQGGTSTSQVVEAAETSTHADLPSTPSGVPGRAI